VPTVGEGLIVGEFTVGEEEASEELAEWQWLFRGYKFGPKTSLEVREIEGLDLPVVRSGDSGRPRDQGMFIGLDVLAGREITIEGDLQPPSSSFQAAWEALATATVPTGTEQYPLQVHLPGYGVLTCNARVRKRQIPVDIQFTLGKLAKVTLLFAAADPRWYGATQEVSVKPPLSVGGFTWPLKWPLKWGGGGYTGALSVTNAGNFETRPVLTIEGPCVNPSIQNATAPGGPTLAFNLTLGAGERLVINTDMHIATLYSSPTTPGSARTGTLIAGSRWWTLEPGTSTIQFLASEGALSVEYASAWII